MSLYFVLLFCMILLHPWSTWFFVFTLNCLINTHAELLIKCNYVIVGHLFTSFFRILTTYLCACVMDRNCLVSWTSIIITFLPLLTNCHNCNYVFFFGRLFFSLYALRCTSCQTCFINEVRTYVWLSYNKNVRFVSVSEDRDNM